MIPGYEPVELDLEKLFLLSVSKENLDFGGKHEKTYKTLEKTIFPTALFSVFSYQNPIFPI